MVSFHDEVKEEFFYPIIVDTVIGGRHHYALEPATPPIFTLSGCNDTDYDRYWKLVNMRIIEAKSRLE